MLKENAKVTTDVLVQLVVLAKRRDDKRSADTLDGHGQQQRGAMLFRVHVFPTDTQLLALPRERMRCVAVHSLLMLLFVQRPSVRSRLGSSRAAAAPALPADVALMMSLASGRLYLPSVSATS